MGHITTTFLRGLGVVLPLVLTVWIVVWLATGAESLLRPLFVFVLPERFYLPGLGFALAVAIVYATGVLVQVFVVQRLWEAFERLFERIPLVKTVYSAISDFFDFFSKGPSEGSKVVSVDVGDGARLIGFITDDAPDVLTEPGIDGDLIAVYLPMSYQVGGYTLLVPKSRVTPLDIGVEQAMRLVLTAGIQGRS